MLSGSDLDHRDALSSHRVLSTRRIVLIAIRNERHREALSSLLRRDGMIVIELEDGHELEDYLELALSPSPVLDVPSLIVCDVELEGRGGLDILLRLRSAGTIIPMVLVRARAEASLIEDADRAGSAAILSDPTSGDELAEVLDLLS